MKSVTIIAGSAILNILLVCFMDVTLIYGKEINI
jgi:hypothetical protein